MNASPHLFWISSRAAGTVALVLALGLAHAIGQGTDAGQVWFLALLAAVAAPALALIALRRLLPARAA